jgi:hypothetical protein
VTEPAGDAEAETVGTMHVFEAESQITFVPLHVHAEDPEGELAPLTHSVQAAAVATLVSEYVPAGQEPPHAALV